MRNQKLKRSWLNNVFYWEELKTLSKILDDNDNSFWQNWYNVIIYQESRDHFNLNNLIMRSTQISQTNPTYLMIEREADENIW